MFRRDYLVKLIEQAVHALARAAARREEGQPVEARQTLDEALRDLLDEHATLFRHVDAKTAARLLADPRRIVAVARILLAQAELLADAGDTASSATLADRARVLYLESIALGGTEVPELAHLA